MIVLFNLLESLSIRSCINIAVAVKEVAQKSAIGIANHTPSRLNHRGSNNSNGKSRITWRDKLNSKAILALPIA
ncbi:MAG: hypothetical protein JW841_07165 [Deltaproteobacteria bacterium]|nr:hypothetical protein [Deltaproteobacteria bacterium]